MSELTKIDAGVVALLGYAVVFMGLVFLMVLLIVMGKIMTEKEKKAKKAADAVNALNVQNTKADAIAQKENTKPACENAPGTAGDLKLYDTNPRDAAMVMAIVADTLNKPINELRFISIREVK